MIASLAMYPFPQVRDATNQLWSAIRSNLGWGPEQLEWDVLTPSVWHEPDLLLAQCCGWPLAAELPPTSVVGTFDYAVPHSLKGSYRSQIVAAVDATFDELRADPTTAAAVNSYSSLSGWISLQNAWKGKPVSFETGAHIESLRAVASGRAQVACVDGVTWALLQDHEPTLVADLHVVGLGPQIPCLPIFVPAAHADKVAELRAAFAAAVSNPALADACGALRIRGFVPLDLADYQYVLTLV